MKVLFIKLGAIGDCVMCVGAVHAIKKRFPETRFLWVCGQQAYPLIKFIFPDMEIIVADEKKLLKGKWHEKIGEMLSLWKKLWMRSFDLVCVGYRDFRYTMIAWTCRKKQIRRFETHKKRPIPLPGRYHGHEYVRLLTDIDNFEAVKAELPNLQFPLPDSFQKLFSHTSTTRIALAPGGAKNLLRDDALRRWPLENYKELAKLFSEKGFEIILTGAKDDAWTKPAFSEMKVVDLIGQTDLISLTALYQNCSLMISHDSGPLHLAALSGVPAIGLFGPTMPDEKFGSVLFNDQKRHFSIWGGENLACRPCYDGKNFAKCKRNLCMEDISPKQVFEKAMEMIKENPLQKSKPTSLKTQKIKTFVSINGRFLIEEKPVGTHRSAMGFTKELLKYQNELNLRVFCNGKKLEERKDVDWLPREIVRHVPINGKVSKHLWEQFIWPLSDRSTIHLNLLNTGPFLFPTKKEIMFIHDLNFWKLKDVFSLQFRAWNRLACIEAAKKAAHIVCFTEYVKEDIVRLLKIPRERITVIHQGSGISNNNPSSLQRMEKSPYFLCVGSLQPHKNLAGVLQAWFLSQLYKKDFKLIVIGKQQENFCELNIDPQLLETPGIVFTGYVTDETLAAYYHHATGFLFPSFHEGFGLPIVEAYEMECPLITSNTSCLPEVAGNAALLVDPTNPEEIADNMKQLAANSNLRADLISRGKERAKIFSWEKAGKQLFNLLQTFGNS